jgi:hypothetical protein
MSAAARRFSLIDAARRGGIPVEELAGRQAESRLRAEGHTRRELIAGATAMAAGAALASHPAVGLAAKALEGRRSERGLGKLRLRGLQAGRRRKRG